MKAGLDTSVILRLLVGEPERQAQVALEYVSRLKASGTQPCVSNLVIAEAYFALQYHYAVPKDRALSALRDLITHDGIEATDVMTGILAIPGLATSQPGFVDRLICQEYLAYVDEVATFEKAGQKLPGVRVLTE